MAMRHPNIVQLCGTTSSVNIRATIFYGDLIPVRQFMELHRHSPILTVYIYAYMAAEFKTIREYLHSTVQHSVSNGESIFFIRRSTGRICVDLAPGNTSLFTYYYMGQRPNQPGFKSLNTPSLEAAALGFLTLEEYHGICYWELSVYRDVPVYNPITVNIGAVISSSSGTRLEDFVFLPRIRPNLGTHHWIAAHWTEGGVIEDGWTRFSSSDAVAETAISLSVGYFDPNYWLSQANHIFKHLGISSNFEDYVILDEITFYLSISLIKGDLPEGFLFLCPSTDFEIGPSSFKWPECPAYWSLDPFGADRLSWEDAANLGFPCLQFSTKYI